MRRTILLAPSAIFTGRIAKAQPIKKAAKPNRVVITLSLRLVDSIPFTVTVISGLIRDSNPLIVIHAPVIRNIDPNILAGIN